jgi:hypothetical protein
MEDGMTEKGNRKLDMLKHTQHLALGLVVMYMLLKILPGGASLPIEILLYGLGGLGVNFGAFVAGNVKGDHNKKDDPVKPD